jgi:hypothetical protein
MNYFDSQIIIDRILRVLPTLKELQNTLGLGEGVFAVQEQTNRKHAIQNWVSIGFKFEKADKWVSSGAVNSSGYKPLWDVYAKDPDKLKEQLSKACESIGVPCE